MSLLALLCWTSAAFAQNKAASENSPATREGVASFQSNNDLNAGFERVADVPEFSYVLGYSPTALKADGSFHALKVRLANGKGLSIEARRGYYALKPDAGHEVRTEIDEEVFSRNEMNDIPIVLQTGYSKINGADHAKVMVAVKVDAKSLHFLKAEGRSGDSLIVVAALFDADGGYVTGTTKTVNLKLRDETLARVINSGITLHEDFDVKLGTYVVRLVVREADGKAMTTRSRPVTIP